MPEIDEVDESYDVEADVLLALRERWGWYEPQPENPGIEDDV
jgi:hypothetical protein